MNPNDIGDAKSLSGIGIDRTRPTNNQVLTYSSTTGLYAPASIAASAATTEPFVTIGNTGGLSAERALTAGTAISVVDGGANTTVTINNTGVTSAVGTTNQVNVSAATGAVTFSTPQNIHTAASPTFANLTLSGITANSFLYSGAAGALTTTVAPTNGQLLIGSTGAAPVTATLTGTANQITITNGAGAITLAIATGYVGQTSITTAGTVTTGTWNAKFTPRVQSVTDAATVTPNADTDDCVDITALAQAVTIANASGTPVNFQKLLIRFKDNATARTISWGTAYVAGGVSLPTTTVVSKILTVGLIYNTANSLNKWQCVATAQEA